MDPTAFDRLVRSFATGNTRRRLLGLLTALPLGGVLSTPRRRGGGRQAAQPQADTSKQTHPQAHGTQAGTHTSNSRIGTSGTPPPRLPRAGVAEVARSRPPPPPPPPIVDPEPCRATGLACNQDSDCCSENCFNQLCAAPPTQCGGVTCPPDSTGCCAGDGCCQPPANQCNTTGGQPGLCCAPNCAGRECGPDGCGNDGTCGSCAPGQTCGPNGKCPGPPVCSPSHLSHRVLCPERAPANRGIRSRPVARTARRA